VRRFLVALFVASLAIAGAALAPACSNQPEGARCDPAAGNQGRDDCNSGLICVQPGQLQWAAPEGGKPQPTSTGICCPDPATDAAATTAVCMMSATNIGNDATIPPSDGGDASDAPAQMDADAAIDAPKDSPPEVTDAGAEGG